ncbi:fimbria/pilus outer membrane usher protein [Agrobacterium fabrum]|uniref:fimbria/pilus outer membrane usher protein n=1 Tax=Agrobacterium fabrum TaxID=1176649 RepID=UPI000EF44F80|nr:fimbria/pilus outer membrane usher protein [Agrobacterium fabrum]AYM60424.1 outer membrane usher protein [Agrobacterium fabrum]NSZ14491.1 fimbrial biogenesis outer membrane usher protein [Agrobacterium fabrum]
MRRRASRAADLAVLTIAGLTVFFSGSFSMAQDIPPAAAAPSFAAGEAGQLQLEVYINDVSTDLIATFRQNDVGPLLIEPDQLKNIGISPVESAVSADGWIDVSRLPEVTARYDESTQSVHFTLPMAARANKVIDASGKSTNEEGDETGEKATSNFGGLVNYTIYGSSGGGTWSDIADFNGVSALLESRVFGPLGVLSSSQVLSTSRLSEFDTQRLDTTWSYSNEETLTTYRAGDLITGGLSWTRPTRLGGLQIRRNFDLRPDIVTMPMPEFAGSAAVPSTVDVYVNNIRRLSQDVPEGPFSITNLPVISGAGNARLVVRDALGREIVSETPFYTSPDLLAKGLVDFSAELGFARRDYGTSSFDYDDRLLGSATVRYGVSDGFTVEGHAEGGEDFYNIGLGGVFTLGAHGLAALSGASSHFGDESGYQISASVEAELLGVRLNARSQRAFGDYNDMASVSANTSKIQPISELLSVRPPRALDQISVSTPLGFDETSLNFSYTQLETFDERRSRLLGLSATRPFGENGNIFITAYKDLEDSNSYGIFAGLSWSFGGGVSGSAGMSSNADGYSLTAEVVKSEEQAEGSYGWRLRGALGGNDVASASGSYRGSAARVSAGVDQFNRTTQAYAQIEGSIAVAGGDVFIGNRIDDAFAVVDAGAPGVDILLENRPIGQTNRRGKILLPNLRSYDINNITLDPSNLPVDARIDHTKQTVRPTERAGAVVNFKVETEGQVALVTLKTESGDFIETGSTGTIDGKREFIVGYDGQAYLDNIGATHRLHITQPTRGKCEAEITVPTAGAERATLETLCRSVQ